MAEVFRRQSDLTYRLYLGAILLGAFDTCIIGGPTPDSPVANFVPGASPGSTCLTCSD